MNYFKLLISVLFIFTVLAGTANAVNIPIDGTDQGRAFEGIGAVSAGGNSRLLIDYEEPYRSNVLDYLFKPNFGANFHHLKVELGGGTNSTSGAVASHAITEDELANPVSRSYQLWLMKKARDLNSDIILDCLAWGFPYWLDSEYSQDTSNYIVSYLDLAKNEWTNPEPQGDVPKGGNLSYYDPARNVTVLYGNRYMWVYRCKSAE